MPKSSPLPLATISRRAAMILTALGWGVNPAGTVVPTSATFFSTSRLTAVLADQSAPALPMPFQTPLNCGTFIRGLSSWAAARAWSSRSMMIFRRRSSSAWSTLPSASSFSSYSLRTVFIALIWRYMTGWVNSGSSVSLWPCRR